MKLELCLTPVTCVFNTISHFAGNIAMNRKTCRYAHETDSQLRMLNRNIQSSHCRLYSSSTPSGNL
jgi:hypothetical protein